MPWKCPTCGFENDGPAARCGGGCGFVRLPKRVVLTSDTTKQQLRMHVSTAVGKTLLMRLDPTDAVYASQPQFEIVRDEAFGAWTIQKTSAARNPTYYNGVPLDDTPQALAQDAVISLGPDRLKLRVLLEDE